MGWAGGSALRVAGIRLGKEANVLFHVERALRQRLRIPFAARDGKEIAAINVDGASQARDRVGYRMDDVAAQRLGVANAERPRPDRLDPGRARRTVDPAPEHVVLAPGVNSD